MLWSSFGRMRCCDRAPRALPRAPEVTVEGECRALDAETVEVTSTSSNLAPAGDPGGVPALLWPMMSGARQPSPWLKPYKIANSRRVLKLCRRPSNCEHFATRLRFTVSTPPIQAAPPAPRTASPAQHVGGALSPRRCRAALGERGQHPVVHLRVPLHRDVQHPIFLGCLGFPFMCLGSV